MNIEKKIHYCWFGYGKKSEIITKCIDSWYKYLPGYEIVEWNEENFDINICQYVNEAYQAKKYAFVSDYARFYILYNYGGIYLDVDVEVLKPLDRFLEHDFFSGFESKKAVAPGLILGAKKGNNLIKEVLDSYADRKFFLDDGSLNTTTVVRYTTDILQKHGLKLNNSLQIIDGMAIYPKTYFCPLNSNSTKTDFSKDTYAIHHYAGTWLTDRQKKRNRNMVWKSIVPIVITIKWLIIRIFGESAFQALKTKIRGITKWMRI